MLFSLKINCCLIPSCMKKILPVKFLCGLVLFLLPGFGARATHIYGADFYYTYFGGDLYTITLAVYGDCQGSAFPLLDGAVPQVSISNGGLFYQNTTLQQVGPAVEVTPVCPSQINNTTCIGGSVPGVKRFIYSRVVSLIGSSPLWTFRFSGDMGNSQAGRSSNITNIMNAGGGSLMSLEATLNTSLGANSSPTFTTIPTPFYSVNIAQQYNQGSVDVNSDSLNFELASALQGAGTVTYQAGYSGNNPLATQPGSFSFSPTTGQMAFTPNILQQSLVVNKVTEYRNGVVVGTASREMTFIVLSSLNNPPNAPSDTLGSGNLNGGLPAGNNTINVCEGTPQVNFQISPRDPDGDTINVTLNGIPSGATATISNNNTTNPSIVFNWPTASVAPGTYTFFATYKDYGCPLSSQQTIAYTIRVIRPNAVTTTVLAPTECLHRATIRYDFSNGLTPRHVVVMQGSTPVKDYTTSNATVTDSLYPGTYTVTVTSPLLTCPTQYTFEVVDSGRYPYRPVVTSPVGYCLNDTPVPLIAAADPGAALTWYNSAGTVVPGPPLPSATTPGIFQWTVDQLYKVCRSAPDTITVYVTQRPVASISAPDAICDKDTAQVSFDGSIGVGPIIAYEWGWDGADHTAGEGAGPWRVHWADSGTRTITLRVLENLCPSFPASRSIRIKYTPQAAFASENACTDAPATIRYNALIVLPGADYTWDFDGGISNIGNTGIGPHEVTWSTRGVKTIFLSVSKEGCTDTASGQLTVHPRPDARILNRPESVCYGDKVYLIGTGSGVHTWTPAERIMTEPDGRIFTRVVTPVTYRLEVTNEYNCSDADSVRYDQITQCCNFSYPNAFSPNDDARNDRFRALTHGNTEKFEFSIYDRWGKRVYWSFNPEESWDGFYKGEPCEMGTYYYYLKARCLTGYEEEQKGELMLVR